MAKCDIPECSGDDSLAFTCNECGRNYCSDHRLPEKHLCQALRSTDKGLDELFATGLQNKKDKKRGLTKRVDSRRPKSDKSKSTKATYPTSSDPPDHIDETDKDDSSVTPDDNPPIENNQSNSWVVPFQGAVSVFWSRTRTIGKKITGKARNTLGPSKGVISRRFRNYMRLVGIGFVLIGGIRLFANYPIRNPGIIQLIQKIESYLHIFPKVGWVSYLLVGLVLFRLAKYRTHNRSIASSLKTVTSVVFIGLLITVLIVAFTPASVPDEMPEAVGDPIQDSAGFTAEVVQNLSAESTTGGSPGGMASPTEDTQVSGSSGDTSSAGLDPGEIEQLIHQKVNERRQKQGLSQLQFDTELREIARYHSKDMAKKEYFSHDSPNGETMGDRYERFGYDCRVSTTGNQYATGGENIYRTEFSGLGFTNEEIAEQTVEAWMDSPGHRENLLKDYWDNEGIGVNVTSNGGSTEIYVTQNFC